MVSSNAVTSSAALSELQSDLTQLSTTLHEVFELMNTDMSQVGQAWQDGKYQEFVDGYKPQIQKCEIISEQYKLWCTKVLAPTIENVIAVERTDVGSGGGSVGGASAASTGTMAGVGATGAATVGSTIGSGFNVVGSQTPIQEPSSNRRIVSRPTADSKGSSTVSKIDSYLNNSNTKKPLSKMDKACIQDTGGVYNHGELGTPSDHHIERTISASDTTNDKLNGGLEVDAKIVKGKFGADTGVSSTLSQSDKIFIKCSKD